MWEDPYHCRQYHPGPVVLDGIKKQAEQAREAGQ